MIGLNKAAGEPGMSYAEESPLLAIILAKAKAEPFNVCAKCLFPSESLYFNFNLLAWVILSI